MWQLTEEQRLIEDSARGLIQSNHDFESRKKRLADGGTEDSGLWNDYAELGWLAIARGEQDGGFGGGLPEIALLMREFGRGLVVEPFLASVVLGGELIARGAHPAVRSRLLGDLDVGRLQLALAFAEPRSRYDLARVATTAQGDGSSGFELSGEKSVVLNGDRADQIIVSARTSGEAGDEGGISLFLVPRSANGLTMTSYRLNDDHRAADVRLRRVSVSPEQVIGKTGDGFVLLEEVIDLATVAVCAEAVGAMEAVMEMTVEYLNTREQFGRAIGRNQALQFRMVEMHYALEESCSMVAGAVRAFESDPSARRAMVSAAKVRVGNATRHIGQEGVQLHGAIGMTEDYAVGHYYKRMETLRVLFGDPDYHLARYGRWRSARNQPDPDPRLSPA